ncbi:hypothetical protein TNCV_1458171 [Trichonephila clavipes]|nr:hypothetical protein TNCV_1458171 [Trichonephila clavipes]
MYLTKGLMLVWCGSFWMIGGGGLSEMHWRMRLPCGGLLWSFDGKDRKKDNERDPVDKEDWAVVARGQGNGSWQACHEFEPSTTKDPPCREAMHVTSAESSNVLPLVWCGS